MAHFISTCNSHPEIFQLYNSGQFFLVIIFCLVLSESDITFFATPKERPLMHVKTFS